MTLVESKLFSIILDQQLSDSGTTGSGSESARPNHLSPGSSSGDPARPNHLSPTQQKRPDLYVDIPHTYVNVYDESQVRGKSSLLIDG